MVHGQARGPRSRVRTLLGAVAAAALLVAAPGVPGAVASAAPAGPGEPSAASGQGFPTRTVTLITGDRVLLRGDPRHQPVVSVAPADRNGRDPAFYSYGSGGDLYVIPSDVARLVGGLLDPALFDVTALAASPLTAGAALPLIVGGTTARAASQALTAGGVLTVDRRLDSIDAVAAHAWTSRAGVLGNALAATQAGQLATGRATPARTGPLAGVTHIWLDQPVHATRLDANLRQVDAPRAWHHGLSGAGVRVAVLDTGIDTTHPDLAGKVVAEANFTPTADAGDHLGHGTHVAAIAAGSGAGSDERRGVAFDADLLNGKVLNDNGQGLFSWIIAGMQWAVQQHARVVNLSVGSGSASDGTDPLSQAVDQLSAESDTLFVVASGNTGGFQEVNSPGAADAALTVGAVDSRDRLAPFSAVGPRVGDSAVKPDITAPGVGIIAARAAGTRLDEPVDGLYVRASGTSMAAPHVAGAAAILAEQHPGWDDTQLKAALVGSADRQRDATVYQQGGGRLDVGTAIRQSLVSDAANVSFGALPFAQDVATRQVTVTNTAAHATWVRTAAVLRGPDGEPMPRGTVSASPQRMRLAAGASAIVTVRLDSSRGVPGQYSGSLIADPNSGPPLRLPLGAIEQPELHNVHLHVTDRRGNPLVSGIAQVLNVDRMSDSPDVYGEPGPALVRTDANGDADVPVRSGHYSVMAIVATRIPGTTQIESFTIAGDPQLTVDGDTTVDIDARTAVPVRVQLEDRATDAFVANIGQTRTDASGDPEVTGQLEVTASVDDQDRLFVQPSDAIETGTLETRTAWRLFARDAPDIVNTVYIGSGWTSEEHHVVTAADLNAAARTDATYRTLGTGVYYEGTAFLTDMRVGGVNSLIPFTAPAQRTEYYVAPASVQWLQCVMLFQQFGPPVSQWCDRTLTTHPPGEHNTSDWLRGPLVPVLDATRSGDTLTLHLNESLDTGNHSQDLFGFGLLGAQYTLYRDGDQLATGVVPFGNYAVHDRGRVRFTLERTLRFDPAIVGRTTATDTTWTFTVNGRGSVNGSGSGQPSVLWVDLDADVDLTNRVPAGEPLDLQLRVGHVPGAADGPIRSVRVWTSADGGTSWQPASTQDLGQGRYAVTGAAPAAGTDVSLRVEARDSHGSRIVQEMVGALGVA